MGVALFVLGLVLAGCLIALGVVARKAAYVTLAAMVFLLFSLLSALGASVIYVGPQEVGIVERQALGSPLSGGRILATGDEMGTQAQVLSPGWHMGYWPGIFKVRTAQLTTIASDEVGLLETTDGKPLPPGQLFAPEFPADSFQQMLDAQHFLTKGGGFKGKQTSVLLPGRYRLNTELFKVTTVKQTEIVAGEVAVLKSNFGTPPTMIVRGVIGALEPDANPDTLPDDRLLHLAKAGEMGVQGAVLPPGKYPLNTNAFTVTEIWTTQMIAHYTATYSGTAESGSINRVSQSNLASMANGRAAHDSTHREPSLEEREITVRTADGFTFPVDVRVEYVIEPKNAPVVVAKLGDDEGDRFRNAFNSAVRAIFRNNAESVRALDYVQQRSHQEEQSYKMLAGQMARFGITVTAVRIGNVGDQKSLGELLDTQTRREIAKQEQITTGEQQKAAEQKKSLERVRQEAEEEKRLATATYAVKIAEQSQRQRIVEAEAEAKAIQIKAEAQSAAYRQMAEQIGRSSVATIELMKIVGERQIQITPRIMIGGNGSGGGGGAGSALMGTILDGMLDRSDPPFPPARPAPPAPTGEKK